MLSAAGAAAQTAAPADTSVAADTAAAAPAPAGTPVPPGPPAVAPPDTVAAPPDTAAGPSEPRRYRIAPMDSTKLRFHRGRFDEPRWVMMRSLLVPGWGQLYNGSWLKALLLGGGEVALIVGIVRDNDSLAGLRAAADRARVEADEPTYLAAVQAYNDRLDRLTSREWLLGGVLVYALADAFVDAHFRDFEVEFEYDPALPQGSGGGARLAARWTF